MEVNARLQNASPGSAEFMDRVAKELREIEGVSHDSLRINCLIDISHFFYLLGQTFRAIEPVIAAVELAVASKSRSLENKAVNLLGVVYADSGNIPKAVECYSQALGIAQALRDSDAECKVWVNIGVALMYAAQYRDAMTSLEHGIHLAGKNSTLRNHRAAAFANIALCCLHLEDYSRGLKAAEASLAESDEPHSAGECVARVIRENNYSRLLLEINDIDKAGERCAIARRYAAQSKSARAEIVASTAEGLYEVHAGRVDVVFLG